MKCEGGGSKGGATRGIPREGACEGGEQWKSFYFEGIVVIRLSSLRPLLCRIVISFELGKFLRPIWWTSVSF